MRRKNTPSVRRLIAMPDEIWREIEAYREREALASIAEAVRRLVLIALRNKQPATPPTPENRT